MSYMTITPTIFHTNSDKIANSCTDYVSYQSWWCSCRWNDYLQIEQAANFSPLPSLLSNKKMSKKAVAVTEAFPTHQWLTVWRDDHNPWQPSSCLSWPLSGLEHPPSDFPVSQSSRKKVQDGDEAKHGENDEDTRVDWQSTAVRESELEWVDQGNRGP